MRTYRKSAIAVAILTVLAACSGANDRSDSAAPTLAGSDTAAPDATVAVGDDSAGEPSTTEPTTSTSASTSTIAPEEIQDLETLNDYVAQAATFDPGAADGQIPAGLRPLAGGAPGYSRYVFREIDGGKVVPTLVEGPLGQQYRCQDEALTCSYLELKALAESDAPVPDELGMTSEELAALVSQLDATSNFAVAHRDVAQACAEGFVSDRIQTPNMGSHFYNPAWIGDGFDPARPEILLYALADGTFPNGPVGQCVDRAWTGEPMKLVGTAFLVSPQVIGNDHPEAFAGPLDNWHIHFNLCRGAAEGRDSFGTAEQCRARGGSYSPALGWMIHAWVDPEHDNQLGVFSMWNPLLAPVSNADDMLATRETRGSDFPSNAVQSLVTNFAFDSVIEVAAGQPIYFNNVDSVPHTVSAGTPEDPELAAFDSGVLVPGQNYALTIDQPGTYTLFCALHTDMTATVLVD
ncbi:MAG: plastocyanin/azurin family copper-binding protein [Ilumatobacteraceae bacterium]